MSSRTLLLAGDSAEGARAAFLHQAASRGLADVTVEVELAEGLERVGEFGTRPIVGAQAGREIETLLIVQGAGSHIYRATITTSGRRRRP